MGSSHTRYCSHPANPFMEAVLLCQRYTYLLLCYDVTDEIGPNWNWQEYSKRRVKTTMSSAVGSSMRVGRCYQYNTPRSGVAMPREETILATQPLPSFECAKLATNKPLHTRHNLHRRFFKQLSLLRVRSFLPLGGWSGWDTAIYGSTLLQDRCRCDSGGWRTCVHCQLTTWS